MTARPSRLATSMFEASIRQEPPSIAARKIAIEVLCVDGLDLGEQIALAADLGIAQGRADGVKRVAEAMQQAEIQRSAR